MTKKPTMDAVAEEMALADSGEATGVFLHELGNVLNNLLLTARLLQRDLPPEYSHRLDDSCRLIGEVAAEMQQLARYRHAHRVASYPVDVGQLTREIVDQLGSQAPRVSLVISGEQPPLVAGTVADMCRIVRLLLQNALAVSGRNKPVQVTLDGGSEQVRLIIEDSGPSVDQDRLLQLCTPFHEELRPGQNQLELAICQNLIRRLDGRLELEAIAGGGVRFAAAWSRVAPSGQDNSDR
jgi:signal transduction histidine kinase